MALVFSLRPVSNSICSAFRLLRSMGSLGFRLLVCSTRTPSPLFTMRRALSLVPLMSMGPRVSSAVGFSRGARSTRVSVLPSAFWCVVNTV